MVKRKKKTTSSKFSSVSISEWISNKSKIEKRIRDLEKRIEDLEEELFD